MSERITRANLEERCVNVNRRMAARGAMVGYAAQGRNGYFGLDRYEVNRVETGLPGGEGKGGLHFGAMLNTVTAGTKRELGEFLFAMMVALDDAEIHQEVRTS